MEVTDQIPVNRPRHICRTRMKTSLYYFFFNNWLNFDFQVILLDTSDRKYVYLDKQAQKIIWELSFVAQIWLIFWIISDYAHV